MIALCATAAIVAALRRAAREDAEIAAAADADKKRHERTMGVAARVHRWRAVAEYERHIDAVALVGPTSPMGTTTIELIRQEAAAKQSVTTGLSRQLARERTPRVIVVGEQDGDGSLNLHADSIPHAKGEINVHDVERPVFTCHLKVAAPYR